MKKTDITRTILLSVAGDVERLRRPVPSTGSDDESAEARRIQRNALNGHVEYRPSTWFGGPLKNADRVSVARALNDMEADGLIERTRDGNRTVAVSLTEKGRRQAERHAAAATEGR